MWKQIPGFVAYEASTDGEIRSVNRNVLRNGHWMALKGKTLKQTPDFYNGRLQRVFVNLSVMGITHPYRVHSLILLTFVGARPEGMEACHRDGNPRNNALKNLRWDTDKSNQADSARHGTKRAPPVHKGETHPRAKLTAAAVAEIRGTPKYLGVIKLFAKKFGVCPITISRIYHGKAWV